MSNVVTKKFVEDGFGFLNQKKLDAFFGLYSEDMCNPTMANLGLPPNKEGFKAFVNGFYASFSETEFLPRKILCEGDTAMFHWFFRGTHTGVFNGVQPSGKRVDINCFTTFRLGPDGKVIEQYDVGDLVTLMRAIGAMP